MRFLAHCKTCSWVGQDQGTEEDALDDGLGHELEVSKRGVYGELLADYDHRTDVQMRTVTVER